MWELLYGIDIGAWESIDIENWYWCMMDKRNILQHSFEKDKNNGPSRCPKPQDTFER